MRLEQILFSQGFGSRSECAGLIAAGRVRIGGRTVDDAGEDFATDSLEFEVDGRRWPFRAKALLMLNKPAGTECSSRPSGWPGVLSLLPAPLRVRGVQPVGRLDADSTGLLLLTDDGALAHRLTSPKHHVHKVYEVTVKHALTERQLSRLREGVVLDDSPTAVRALACEQVSTHALRLTLDEGRYHQVKRMLAAVGNRVVALHRSAVGALTLPPDLAPGDWRWIEPSALYATRAAETPMTQ